MGEVLGRIGAGRAGGLDQGSVPEAGLRQMPLPVPSSRGRDHLVDGGNRWVISRRP
jgi:hypothetical protein